MAMFNNTDLGKLVLRLGTGVLMLPHGIAKLQKGHGKIKQMLVEDNLPEWLWMGVPISEVIAPICLILGVCTRLSGLLISVVMVFAILLAKGPEAFYFGKTGGFEGELNFLFFICGLVITIMGGGKYSLFKPKNTLLQ